MSQQTILLVEDEQLIALMLEDAIRDLGWAIAGSARTQADALTLLSNSTPNLALLDIKLGLTTSLEVAAQCRNRSIPVVFITGYAARDLPDECGDAPVLPKPFTFTDLALVLRRGMSVSA